MRVSEKKNSKRRRRSLAAATRKRRCADPELLNMTWDTTHAVLRGKRDETRRDGAREV